MAKIIRSLAAVIVLLFVGLSLTLVVMLTTFHSVRADTGIIYVDRDAPGPSHDGLSWTTAYTNVQAALAAAVSSDEIWVAEGVYTPGGAGERTATFTLANGVALYGGFAATETLRTERDPATNVTILSGDIDDNDTNTDGNYISETASDIQGANSYHAVTASGADSTAVLDGFVVTAGQANGSSPNDLGGGMYNDPGSPTLSHVTFSGNSAAGYGGGMYNNSSSPTLSHVTFSGNSAYYGGGISISAYAGHTSVLNSVISNNFAAINGGGIYCAGSLTVDSSTVSGNAATNYGGGIWNNGTLTIQNDTTIGGAGAGNTAGTGGGVYNNGNLTVNASTISSNEATADHGGGIYTDTSGTTTVNASLAILNHTWSGGGSFNKGILIVQNGSIIGGTGMGNSVNYDGGGIYNDDGGTTTVDASTVSHNTAGWGGGIFNGDILVVQNASLVSANTATYGGGIHNGGGYNGYYGNTTVDTSTISANSAYLGGGIWSQGTLTILNSLVAANTASYAGGIYNAYGATTVTASTFSGNSAADTGGGVYNCWDSNLMLTNVILWDNSAPNGAEIYNQSSTPVIAYSDIQGSGGSGAGWDSTLGTDGGGNIDADPRFVDTANDNLRLGPGSPAIDAGDSTACPSHDLDGVSRPVGFGCDMGAYERDAFTATVSKWASDLTPVPGQVVSFTVAVTNTGPGLSGGLISDTLPAGLNFVGPITLDPPEAGVMGSTPPTLAHSLVISANHQVTVTFPISVAWALEGGTHITNTAAFTAPMLPAVESASVVLVSVSADTGIIYVDRDTPGPTYDGLSWTTAFTNVQAALAAAVSGDEIWVAEGVYTPGSADQRDATFTLVNGVGLYGGFAATETLRTERDWAANITVLSGDIDQNDTTDPHGVVTTTANIVGTNAYHVVSSSGVTETAVLDGFIITAGQADIYMSYPEDRGGGMVNYYSSPTLTNLTLSGNYSIFNGGGMYNEGGSPMVTKVIFSGNQSEQGGGLSNAWGSPTLTDVTFSGNSASWRGGGLMDNMSSSTLMGVTFSGNSSNLGGGMCSSLSGSSLANVTFSNNQGFWGGGMFTDNSNPTLTNITFSGNRAEQGGGIYSYNNVILKNVIIAYSTSGGDCVLGSSGSVNATYTFIEDTGTNACGLVDSVNSNIIGQDPRLGPLQDNGGDTTTHALLPGSPAIDSGTDSGCPAADQRGTLRPVGFGCDMGAYELSDYSVTLHKSTYDTTPAPGQVVTFTVAVTNTGPGLSGGLISDTLPAGLNFVGPITLDPPEAGVMGSTPPTLAHSLVISANHQVTVTLPISVAWGLAGGTAVTNTVTFTSPVLAAVGSSSVTLVVAHVAPLARDDAFNVDEDSTSGLDVLGNDADANGDSLSISAVGTPDRGGTVINGGVVVSYTPELNFAGTEVFTYTVSDGHGGLDTAWVTVTVNYINDPPFFTSVPVTTATEDMPYTYAVTADDPELISGDALTVTVPTLPGWLTLTDHGDGTATLSGTPTNAHVGDHPVVLEVTDSGGLYATQSFTITVVEKPWYRMYLPLVLRNTP